MNTAWSIYPGANGGGPGDQVGGADNALSRGLGDVGRNSGNMLGMLGMIGGLAAGALSGMNRFGNRFKLYREFKEKYVKRPWQHCKNGAKRMLGMSGEVAKGGTQAGVRAAGESLDDASRAIARGANTVAGNSVLVDQYGRPMAAAQRAAGAIDDIGRSAANNLDDAAGAAKRGLSAAGGAGATRMGARVVPVLGAAVDGAFRYQDYKTVESRYESAQEKHKQGAITDEQLAVETHFRNAGHSRNAAGMAGGLLGAAVAGAGVGAAIGATGMGVGAIPGFLIGAGVGVVGYYVGSKTGETASDLAWGNPPSYSKDRESVERAAGGTTIATQQQGHDAAQAWAAARDNSSYAHTGDIRTPGVVRDQAAVAKFSNDLAGSGAAPRAPRVEASQAKTLARGRGARRDLKSQSRQNTL